MSDFAITLQSGYQFQPNEVVTLANLNRLGKPTANITLGVNPLDLLRTNADGSGGQWHTAAAASTVNWPTSDAAGGSVAFAHALEDTPDVADGRLVCATTEAGYAVGDAVNIAAVINYTGSVCLGPAFVVVRDGTNITLIQTCASANMRLAHKTTGTLTAITRAYWSLKVAGILLSA